MTSLRITHLDPDKTYPFITQDGIIEMTPSEANVYKPIDPFKKVCAEKIRNVLLRYNTGLASGEASGRWDQVKEFLYVVVNGEFDSNMLGKNRAKKYRQIDLTSFQFEKLEDSALLDVFELVVSRYYRCM